MVRPLRRRATYADLVALPEHLIGEIIDGELIVSPRPAPAHAFATGGLLADLLGPFDRGRGGPGGWWILFEPELHFGRDVVIPDLAGWRRERMPAMPREAFFRIAPDWLCETLSPSTESIDRARKLRVYGRAGVNHVWLIDPDRRTLEAFARDGRRWTLLDAWTGDVRVRVPPFEAIELDLAPLWLPEPPPAPKRPRRRRRG